MFAAVLVGFPVYGGQQTPPAPARHFLWQVEKGERTVFLLGSIHALKEDAYPLPPVIEEAFDRAEIAVFEVDLGEMTSAALKMMSAGTLEGGKTLEQVVGAETWRELEQRVEDSGLPSSVVSQMKPWMAALTLTALELTRGGYIQSAGLDSYFFERAKSADKERIALETVDFQVGLFAGLSSDQSRDFLDYTLRDLDAVIPMLDELAAQWRAGDVEPVAQLLTEGFAEFPGIYRKIVTDRNRSWMDPIEELLAGERDAIVVVGSLHLVGGEGLVALLRDLGYRVVQL